MGERVLVTGITGFIGQHCAVELLNQGYEVVGSIRSKSKADSTRNAIGKVAPIDQLSFAEADLLSDKGWDVAMKGCDYVLHVASPFMMKEPKDENEMIAPAVEGTERVISAAQRNVIKRLVLTSSTFAIIAGKQSGHYGPNDWSDTGAKIGAYAKSKTLAERAAWEINKEQLRWDLVVINPSLVIGPGINPHSTSESFNIIRQLGDGTGKMGTPEFFVGAVDVRDLAEAHFNAGFFPGAQGRHIISAREVSLLELSEILQKKYGNQFPFPKKNLPKFMIWLLAPMAGVKRKMVRKNVGYHWLVDNSKSIRELGINYRPVEESITDYFQQMIDLGVFKK